MNLIECPVCDWTLDLTTQDDYEPGLLGLMGVLPTTLSARDTEKAELQLFEHLSTHSVVDWVRAMTMADAYIDKLETGLMESAALVARLSSDVDKATKAAAMARRGQGPIPAPYLPGQEPMFIPDPYGELSPRDRQEQLTRDRRAGIVHVPTDTLIPVLGNDRPEGMVGRKR